MHLYYLLLHIAYFAPKISNIRKPVHHKQLSCHHLVQHNFTFCTYTYLCVLKQLNSMTNRTPLIDIRAIAGLRQLINDDQWEQLSRNFQLNLPSLPLDKFEKLLNQCDHWYPTTHIAFCLGLNRPAASFGDIAFIGQIMNKPLQAFEYFIEHFETTLMNEISIDTTLQPDDFCIDISATHSHSLIIEMIVGNILAIAKIINVPSTSPYVIGYPSHTSEFGHWVKEHYNIQMEHANNISIRFKKEEFKTLHFTVDQRALDFHQKQLKQKRLSTLDNKNILEKILLCFETSENLARVNLKYVANQLNVGESTLRRQCQQYQINFKDLLNSFRNKRAIELLTFNQNIDDIAIELGFTERSSFERYFKQNFGITPTQLRTQLPTPEDETEPPKSIELLDINESRPPDFVDQIDWDFLRAIYIKAVSAAICIIEDADFQIAANAHITLFLEPYESQKEKLHDHLRNGKHLTYSYDDLLKLNDHAAGFDKYTQSFLAQLTHVIGHSATRLLSTSINYSEPNWRQHLCFQYFVKISFDFAFQHPFDETDFLLFINLLESNEEERLRSIIRTTFKTTQTFD